MNKFLHLEKMHTFRLTFCLRTPFLSKGEFSPDYNLKKMTQENKDSIAVQEKIDEVIWLLTNYQIIASRTIEREVLSRMENRINDELYKLDQLIRARDDLKKVARASKFF